ncbi:kinase-like domain, phloem protein 2-like protein [Tanacetum coccineum]
MLQGNLEHLKIGLNDINEATKNFDDAYSIGSGGFGKVYKADLEHFDSSCSSSIYGVDTCDLPRKQSTKLRNDPVYEHASKGSLENYLGSSDKMTNLTWVRRLNICLDIAHGLNYIHNNTDHGKQKMIQSRHQRAIKFILGDNWEARMSIFGSRNSTPSTNQAASTIYTKMIAGWAYDSVYTKANEKGIAPIARDHFRKGTIMKIVDHKIKEETDEHVFSLSKGPNKESLDIFLEITFRCVAETQAQRPTIEIVIKELKKAIKHQRTIRQHLNPGHFEDEDYETWEPKLPKDYKEIIQMSKCPEHYSNIKKEDLYNIFSKGILLQQEKVLLSFDGIGERKEMVSATMFSYKNSCPHEWKSLPESRFETVVEMLDISYLNIEIKTKAQFLTPNVVYGVYLVFKFCDSRNLSSKPMYVHLKYRKGRESQHAYFATWRDNEWMMIELNRFLNEKQDFVAKFLLESFSPCYCADGAIYVEGVEFRSIEKGKHEEIGKLKEVQQGSKSNLNVDQVQQLPTNFEEIFKMHSDYDELFWLGEVHGKKFVLLSAKATLYKSSNVDLFTSKPSSQSRFPEVIELLPQKVFHINCTIKSQMLSSDTEYMGYLLFKLSENCQGMDCPVKIRDVLHQKNNEAEFFYFTTPNPLNINDITRVPKQREDGWMEILLWKFNSAHEFKYDSLFMNMKFTSLEGIMSGLIVCGLEFRPM